MEVLIGLIFLLTPFVLLFLLFKAKKKHKKEIEILDLKYDELKKDFEKYSSVKDLDTYKLNLQNDNKVLEENIKDLQKNKDELNNQIIILDEEKTLQEYGLYKPIFDYEDSEAFRVNILKIKDKQKDMIKDKVAATCYTDWEVGGSKVEGRKLINNNIKLALRAFNGDCDVSISKVNYNNVNALIEKIKKSFDAINKTMETQHITINTKYLNLRLDELKLTHEFKEKQYEEKEEQRRIKEEMREEEKALKELEKAQRDAEQEEFKYQKALEKARIEVEKTTGEKHNKLLEEIQRLEAQLLEAQANKQRAISQAQLTRSGHVYVISNIGSFGENIYKIGMTRRLEPLDRVKELGDASVPFPFDVHAMIYSHDAPTLERKLHISFNNKRVNMINERREFFNVSLDEIKKEVEINHGEFAITKLAEAKEYRESLVMKESIAS
ncbi:MAG: DUF4041 domain-containing protein [Candidatus Paceibacteria bacterium]